MIAQVIANGGVKVLEGMKQITVSNDTTLTTIDSDLKLVLTATESIDVTMYNASFIGCEVLVINMSNESHDLIQYSATDNPMPVIMTVEPYSVVRLVYTNKWIPETNMIPTSSPSNANVNGSIWFTNSNS